MDSRIELLTEKLADDSVVFFAGSGVSYSSQLPSADDILRRTCQKLLPSLNEDQVNLILGGQPEVVYTILLECSHHNLNCLDMWKCLSPLKWTKNYAPQPNFEHCFIAAYSKRAKVPIFTVNYDTMFEEACKKLGMTEGKDYAVVTECTELDFPHDPQDMLYICKLHGDIARIGDQVDPNMFKTTMVEIAKKNSSWLNFLFQIMEKKHICFAGYSGRDIDYYPFLKQRLNDRQALESFWSLDQKMERDIGFPYAAAITHGWLVPGFPCEFFPDIYETVFSEKGCTDKQNQQCNRYFKGRLQLIRSAISTAPAVLSSAKEQFLLQIKDEIRDARISDAIFLMRFLQVQGKNEKAECVFKDQLASNIYNFEAWEQLLILEAKMMMAREHARFIEYRETAKELLYIARKERKQTAVQEEIDALRGKELNARMQIISSYQMEIPTHLCFKLPLRLRGYGRLFAVKLGFCLLDMAVQFAGKSFCRTNSIIIQEGQIRSLAMDVRLAGKLQKSNLLLSRWFVNYTIKRLEKLREAAYEVGNYETVIGTMKYLARLLPEESFKADAKTLSGLVSDLSAISILERDDCTSEEEFQKKLSRAKDNDNTLNILKLYLENTSHRIKAEEAPFSDKDYALELIYYMNKVESVHLKKCFSYIRRKYLRI